MNQTPTAEKFSPNMLFTLKIRLSLGSAILSAAFVDGREDIQGKNIQFDCCNCGDCPEKTAEKAPEEKNKHYRFIKTF